ncbi:MAG: hypothetical protein KatS3mg061_2227 [Dehalococcoidia bacterium]|nr:MAG: hypothetical protein KatS3mg061_2227 [Dehalococcoidia bacterium]
MADCRRDFLDVLATSATRAVRTRSQGRPRSTRLSTVSSTFGITSTRAKDVCRRWAASKGEIRTSRCTPPLALQGAIRVSGPLTLTVTPLESRLPPQASGRALRSGSREHRPSGGTIRSSISAQSCDFGPSRARVDGEERVLAVVRAAEHQLKLQSLAAAPASWSAERATSSAVARSSSAAASSSSFAQVGHLALKPTPGAHLVAQLARRPGRPPGGFSS